MNQSLTRKFNRILMMTVVVLISIFSVTNLSYAAESIYDIDIQVELQDDGSAHIIQRWNVNTEEGTEFYIPMTNMRDMEIQDFKVYDENGTEFTNIGDWEVDASLDEKAYKNGINYVGSDSVELCWGKGSYGEHVYILSYTLTNMVQNFPDNDGFISRFINDQMSPAPEHGKVTITRAGAEANASFVPEETGVYAFGYSGYINVLDGEIIAETDTGMSGRNHMTLMVRLPKGMLNPVSVGSGTFADLEERAKDGSDYTPDNDYAPGNDYGGSPGFISASSGFNGFAMFVVVLVVGIFGLTGAAIVSSLTSATPLASDYKKLAPRYKDLDYYRDLPLGNNLEASEYALKNAGKPSKNEDIMGSFILRLVKDGVFEVTKETETRLFMRDRETTNILLNPPDKIENPNELAFYKLIQKAAGSDNILQEKELKKYAQRNYSKIDDWLDDVRRSGEASFGELGGYTVEVQDKLFGSKSSKKITDKGVTMINQVLGFKKFLEDFTLIGEREVREVALWDGYLIFAALFGIADKVAKEMKRIYPDFENVSELTGGGNTDMLTMLYLTNSMNRAMASGYNSGKYESEGGSRSSGGGGGASFGGGGGFSGGGSGGGSR